MKPRRVEMEMPAKDRAHLHFRRRAWERYGLALSAADIAGIEATIRRGDSVKSVHFCATRAGHSVRVRGKLIVVLYDSEINAAVTALPMVAIAKRLRDAAGRS
jgi:hypothetical protein